MSEYKVSNYDIFNNAISTTTNLSNSLNTGLNNMKIVDNIIKDESILMGPVVDEIESGIEDSDKKVRELVSATSKFKEYFTSTATNYKNGDTETSNNILEAINGTGAIASTPSSVGISTSTGTSVDSTSTSTSVDSSSSTTSSSNGGIPKFGSNGLLIRQQSDAGQQVINGLFAAGTSNAKHSASLDSAIDALSPEECLWVLSRIENGTYGQTGDGFSSNTQSAKADQTLIDHQINKRFGGDIHNLLKHWGTYSYSGY